MRTSTWKVWVSLAVLGLAGCASSPSVKTWVVAPAATWPSERAVAVNASSPEVAWATRQALEEQGWQVRLGAPLALDAMERQAVQFRTPAYDPWCDRRWPGYWGYPYGVGPRWGCDPFWNQPQAYTVREVTWVVRDTAGRTVWSATSRESGGEGPPLMTSRRLSVELDKARAQPLP